LASIVTATSKQVRAANRDEAPWILAAAGIVFTVHNQGAHIRIYDRLTVDYWPGPDKWKYRNKIGYGMPSLIAFLKG